MSTTSAVLASATGAAAAPTINLNNTLGALLIGLVFAAMFFGVTNVQVLIYYQGTAARDSKPMRTLVGALWVLDFLHLVLISHLMYFYLITNFGDEGIVTDPVWSFCTYVVVTALSNFIVQIIYIRRLYIMSGRNWLVTIVPAILTFVAFGFGFSVGALAYTYTSTLQLQQISWVVYVGLSASLVENAWASLALCYYIGRSKTGFKSTDALVNKLMAYIINTGLLTSVCAFCCFITFATMKTNFIYLAFYFSYAKLHYNALLAMFNARSKLVSSRSPNVSASESGMTHSFRLSRFRAVDGHSAGPDAKFTSIGPVSPGLGGFTVTNDDKSDSGSSAGPRALAVSVHTEVEYNRDYDHSPSDICFGYEREPVGKALH